MVNYDNAIQYIEQQEATEISYVKIGNGNKKLIVTFGSNQHDGFDRKKSLMELKYERNNFDVLYLRNQYKWYLGGLNGIGKNINHTIAFLKKEFAKYDQILCVGSSAGGYASLLFGSLLNVNFAIAINAQTDLQYCVDNIDPHNNHQRIQKQNLIKRSKQCPVTWSKYNKIVNVLNGNVLYNVFYKGDANSNNPYDLVVHGDYHYEQIKSFPNVTKVQAKGLGIIKFINEAS